MGLWDKWIAEASRIASALQSGEQVDQRIAQFNSTCPDPDAVLEMDKCSRAIAQGNKDRALNHAYAARSYMQRQTTLRDRWTRIQERYE